jgi:hypothetical protein
MPEDMKMKYDPLLALPWTMLPAASKREAIAKAAQAGRELSYYAIVASGGSEMCLEDGSLDDYVFYIIDDADFRRSAEPEADYECERKYWGRSGDGLTDPRLKAFLRTWNNFMCEERIRYIKKELRWIQSVLSIQQKRV